MRIALISDIHGNDVAFSVVQRAIHADSPDAVICLGDVAASGPQPAATLERLQSMGCRVVQGNTDAALIDMPQPPDDPRLRMFHEIDSWCAAQLTDRHREFLRTFQPTVTYELPGEAPLLCFHGTPRSYDEMLTAATPDELLAEIFAGADARILAGGHSHAQMLRRFRTHLLINPGSVGLPFERLADGSARNPGRAEYAVIDVTETGIGQPRVHIDLRQIPYDRSRFVKVLLASGLPHAGQLARGWK